jgi:hypothetical protein
MFFFKCSLYVFIHLQCLGCTQHMGFPAKGGVSAHVILEETRNYKGSSGHHAHVAKSCELHIALYHISFSIPAFRCLPLNPRVG